MNSLNLTAITAPYRLRALRELDLEGLPQLFPESTAEGRELADRRAWLRDVESIAWGKNPRLRLVLEEIETGQALAGFTFERKSEAVALLRYGFRPTTAMTQIAGFVLAREFAFESLRLIAIRTEMVQGQDPLAAVHEEIGYSLAVRLREWWHNAAGEKVDLLTYEAVNPAWEKKHER